MDRKVVYMDYSATTYTKPEVLEEMLPYFTGKFGNPSSKFYSVSQDPIEAIDSARERVAKGINSEKDEIYFTSGGSEADNWAIKGVAFANKNKGNHIITTAIEHHAVLHSCEFLKRNGFEITYLPVNDEGLISLEDLKNAIKDNTILVTIMFANNEIGAIQSIKEIGKICRERKVLFHTDAVQAMGHVPIDVKDMNIDMLSMAGHKFYGPKGIGALYIRKGVRIENLIHGGGQEKGKRGTTENVPGIVGIGKAIELATEHLYEEKERLTKMRDRLIEGLMNKIPHTKLNGPTGDKRLPNNVNLSFIGIEGETLLLDLDFEGVCASTGSACASGSLDPSHVLLSIGLSHGIAHGSLRLTLGEGSTEEDVDYILNTLPDIVKRRREMSPYWEDYLKSLKEGEK
ncbi:cysteine desulfurase NifS [Clostridium tetani]|uniref:Cysteine desulfurase IscS n=1 Tax=Clostridium tetani (strain Massachusetts / E88) TaxID=212717 RepID=Q896F7_CLOTE|nr:cysteine desulfurase NifS [Clostridium tetani]AAO35633.1 cysteine desulfhydrase [Clostridium tetani E88]AVP54470.1 cysteine desulfurase NifS [Clostridium tetani]KGI36967.1 cysteine desulfurase [Clostridium tetani]KGI40359.1 cysteine desulfurase [Clostridium tetani ATCC 9441]KGI42459.1 cysteine desulfurase [Clostridium tetani]